MIPSGRPVVRSSGRLQASLDSVIVGAGEPSPVHLRGIPRSLVTPWAVGEAWAWMLAQERIAVVDGDDGGDPWTLPARLVRLAADGRKVAWRAPAGWLPFLGGALAWSAQRGAALTVITEAHDAGAIAAQIAAAGWWIGGLGDATLPYALTCLHPTLLVAEAELPREPAIPGRALLSTTPGTVRIIAAPGQERACAEAAALLPLAGISAEVARLPWSWPASGQDLAHPKPLIVDPHGLIDPLLAGTRLSDGPSDAATIAQAARTLCGPT